MQGVMKVKTEKFRMYEKVYVDFNETKDGLVWVEDLAGNGEFVRPEDVRIEDSDSIT